MDPTLLVAIISVVSSAAFSALAAFITVRFAIRQLRQNQELADKTAKQNQESADKTAKQNQESADKTAKQNQELADKTAKQNQELADKAAQERQDDLIRNNYDDLISERRAIVFASIDDPVTCSWILKRFDLDPNVEEHRMYVLGLLQIDHYEHIFYRYWHGLFPAELWPQWQKSMYNTFPSPEFIKIMESRFRYTLSDSFWAYYSLMCPDNLKPHDSRFTEEKLKDLPREVLSREVLPSWSIIVKIL